MLKRFFKYLKKFIMAAVLLYTYNQFSVSFDATIPINLVTIFSVTFLGIPAMIGLIVFGVMFY